MTVQDLLDRFAGNAGREFNNDRILLSAFPKGSVREEAERGERGREERRGGEEP